MCSSDLKEMINYAETYWCDSPQITLHMKMSELVTEGTAVFSGSFEETEGMDYTILGLQRYAFKTNRNIVPYFFKYSRSLETALYRLPDEIKKKIKNELDNYAVTGTDTISKINQTVRYLSKVRLLQEVGFPVVPQPMKYSGFEKIKDYYDDVPNLISAADKIKYFNKPSKRAFDIAFRYKLADTIGFCEKEPNTLHYYA